MKDFSLSPAFFWLFWSFTTVFGIVVGWWLRMAFREKKMEHLLEIREQERQHLAHQLMLGREAQDMKEADLKKAELSVARLQTEIEAFDRERQLLLAAVESAAQNMLRSQQQNESFQSKLQSFEEQILGLRTRNAYLTGEINQRKEEINAYKNLHMDFIVLQKNVRSLEEAVAQIESERNLATHELESAWVEINNLETQLINNFSSNGRHSTNFESQVTPTDDLKIINGISPFAEKKLRSVGIHTFEQIASWDEKTIAEMNDLLGFYPQKIIKEDWVGQAKHLISI